MTTRTRRLVAARITSAAVLGILGQLLTGSTQSYFGPPDSVTRVGIAYVAALVILLALGLFGLARDRPWSRAVASLLPALNVAAFVQPIVGSPLIAGTLLLWNLWLVGTLLAPGPTAVGSPRKRPAGVTVWLHDSGPAARHLLWISALTTVVLVGFERTEHPAVPALCGLLAVLALTTGGAFGWQQIRSGAYWPWIAVLVVATPLAMGASANASMLASAAAELLLLAHITVRDASFSSLRRSFFDHPALLILVSFLVLIAMGTLLLSFPAASTAPGSIGIVDAAFTATSAVCVTGLIVLDTPEAFTTFGHVVILLLIQIGGLNIMVLSTFGAILLGRGLGLRGERALGEILDVETPETAYRLIAFIVTATLAAEAVGAAFLGLAYRGLGTSLLESAWLGVFHAVSAFCNAGFALHSDSLVLFREAPLVLLVFAALITAGGLGFVVLARFLPWTRTRELSVMRTHARVVLISSATLVVLGATLYATGEWNRSLAGLSTIDRVANAIFQSVTLRTAGFNSVPLDAVGQGTSLWMMMFMFIGASPGGTGGGIKTTTAVLLLAAIPATVRGHSRAVVAGRTVSLAGVYRSAAIVTGSTLVVAVGGVLLLATQGGTFQQLLFETFSAVGTVGLSLGSTASLDSFGKTVIIALMLIGRIGPLSLALLLGRRVASRVSYPEARILVG